MTKSPDIPVGSRWREVDSRFVRIVEVVEHDDDRVVLRTVSTDGVENTSKRTTRVRLRHFLTRFTHQPA